MTKISDLSALTGASVDAANDLVTVVDMSATGVARNKKMTFVELKEAVAPGTAAALDVDTDDTLAADSDTVVPSQAAVKAYVDGAVAGGVTYATAAEVQAGTESAKAIAPDQLIAAAAPQTLTDGATIAWDMAAGFNAKVTLGGNRTLGTPTNPKAGLTYSLAVIQDATGSRTMTWPSAFDWGTTGAPTLTTTASKRDRITLFCTDAATPKFDAFLSGKGFS